MKLLQTLWLPDKSGGLMNSCGWVSPEYHWMSWSLSALLLHQHGYETALYTTKEGRDILINLLQLPYNNVFQIREDEGLNCSTWALAKILTYQQQTQAFLHIDGDVYLFEKLPDNFLHQALLVQNEEIGFPNYTTTINWAIAHDIVHSSISPSMVDKFWNSYNAGLFGGNDIDFIKEFSQEAITFVQRNLERFQNTDDSTGACMLFEQWLFYQYAKEKEKKVTPFLADPVVDEGYPGISDFFKPHCDYIHLMGLAKKNRFILKQLANKLKQLFPSQYYHVLKVCKNAGVKLDYAIYDLEEFNPSVNDVGYFVDVHRSYDPFAGLRGWKYQYAKDLFVFNCTASFNSLPKATRYEQSLALFKDIDIREEENHVQLYIHDTYNLQPFIMTLEEIEIAIIGLLEEQPMSLNQLVEQLEKFFDADDFYANHETLRQLVNEKILSLMQRGVIVWNAFMEKREQMSFADAEFWTRQT